MYETLAFLPGTPSPLSPASRQRCFGTGGSTRTEAIRFSSGAVSCRASVGTFAPDPPVISPGRRRGASLYEVLKVKETASLTEIKSAYRSLAKVYHPDASESDGRDFIEIHKAYTTLADPRARAIYDSSMESRRRSPMSSGTGRPIRVYTTRRWETDQCW